MDLINKKSKIQVVFLIVLLFLIVGCKNESFEKRLIDFTEKSCLFIEKSHCNIDLNKLAGTNIDSILIFDAGTINYDISRVLRYDYKNKNIINDECVRIMLISGGKIIQEGDVNNSKMCFFKTDSVLSLDGKAFYFCKKYNTSKLVVERSEERDANNVTFYYAYSK